MKLFCFGLGYTASHLVRKLSPSSWQYSGTKTKEAIRFDSTGPVSQIRTHLKGVTHVLISIPPNKMHIDSTFHYHANELQNLPSLKWVGYLSATSVYGDWGGDWVDENTEVRPSTNRGKLRREAEKLWQDADLPTHIFRLGGIYGPERNQINNVKTGRSRKIIKKNHYFSRIHVDDLCDAVIKSMENPSPGSIYNLVDDLPAPASDILDYLCDILNRPRIRGVRYKKAELSDGLRKFYAENRRVNNKLTKEALDWEPKYPNFREGYLELLRKLD